ncbi:MAG: hypothetical protein RTV41_02595 [Candidatus Thorarchaeota archaeon]
MIRISDSLDNKIPGPTERVAAEADCVDELGDVLLIDDFISAPIGFNNSLWNLHTVNDPTLTWEDGESQILNSERFMYTTLESVVHTGPEVIAEFNLSFTGGLSYFGVGWADGFQDSVNNWISNLRVCQNGVFIDFWDSELLLVTCSDGLSVSTIIQNLNISVEHCYRLSWSESIIRLHIDGVERGIISRHIPSVGLPFTITSSGHHYLVDQDRLTIDRVGIYERELCETEEFPKISLIWPSNTSTLYPFDVVDVEIAGESGRGLYSWDGETNSSFLSPWDIPVPSSSGLHMLDVYANDSENNWVSLHTVFTVIQQETSISIYDSVTEPLIDGIVSNEESVSFTKFETSLRGEDWSEIPFDLFIGYHNDSLYVGVITTLKDRYHSRISLYIDGAGTGIWGDSELGSMEDIRITSEAPRANQQYRGIYTPHGQEVNPLGVVYDSGVSDSGVTAEYLIPVQSVLGNSSIGLGLYLVVSQGGFNSYFPVGDLGELIIVRSSGLRVSSPVGGQTFVFILAIGSIIATVVLVLKQKKPGTQIEVTLEDEKLERIRTLLHSHPEISIERLALLANTDTKSVRASIDQMMRNDLISPSVIVTEKEVVRTLTLFEKKQK